MRFSIIILSIVFCSSASPLWAQHAKQNKTKATISQIETKPVLDHSGQARKGKASYYGKQFYGRTMADGTPMNPHSNVAASRTLPLGTKAEVTNLENGKTEVVEIKDRGPYIDGRIIDLSPTTADKLGMLQQGVIPVEVRPIEVPQPDGSVKPGVAILESESVTQTSGE
jgi:rare lipoprotein A